MDLKDLRHFSGTFSQGSAVNEAITKEICMAQLWNEILACDKVNSHNLI
jgi:hypothetical protein